MFKATEVGRKTRKIDLLIDLQINLSSGRTQTIISCCFSGHYQADSDRYAENVLCYICFSRNLANIYRMAILTNFSQYMQS